MTGQQRLELVLEQEQVQVAAPAREGAPVANGREPQASAASAASSRAAAAIAQRNSIAVAANGARTCACAAPCSIQRSIVDSATRIRPTASAAVSLGSPRSRRNVSAARSTPSAMPAQQAAVRIASRENHGPRRISPDPPSSAS